MTAQFRILRSSSLPLHLQLLDELRHNIKNGVLQPHDRLPGEWELVESLEISRATIQKAWQAAQDEGLIYRIAGKGTFVAPPAPVSGRGVVGVLLPEYRGTFAVNLLNGLERVLRKSGFRVQLASTDRDLAEESMLLQNLLNDNASGCIMVPARAESSASRWIGEAAQRMPIVLMDRPINGMVLPCVCSHHYEGGVQAMEHLIGLGHRRILFVSRPHLDLWSVSERYRAYQDVLRRENAEPMQPCLIGAARELSSYETYAELDLAEFSPLLEILSRAENERPTAIFAVNDWIAVKVQQALNAAERRVPEDVSLIGFDDLDIAQFQDPPLTTIAQNGFLIGTEAARRLITCIEGEASESIFTLIPTRLVQRSSTAAVS